MSITDHYKGGAVEKVLVTIITSDPVTKRVEVVGKDAAVIQVEVGTIPVLFRWPQLGEYWTIVRENGIWKLADLVQDPNAVKGIKDLLTGEAIVQAEKI